MGKGTTPQAAKSSQETIAEEVRQRARRNADAGRPLTPMQHRIVVADRSLSEPYATELIRKLVREALASRHDLVPLRSD